MVITPVSGVPMPVSQRAEWWERALTVRRDRGTHHRRPHGQEPGAAPRGSAARSAASWLCLGWVLLVCALSNDLRLGVLAFAAVAAVLLVWFLLARTRTMSWRFVTALFAAGVLWGATVGTLSVTVDLHVVETALLAVPLAVLPLLAPGRVRRFSLSDWMLAGIAPGLGYSAAAAVTATVAGRATSLDEVTDARYLVHALGGLLAGLALAAWRHGSRRGQEARATSGRHALAWRTLAVLAPAVAVWLLLGTDLPADGPARAVLTPAHAVADRPVVLLAVLAVLGVVALLLDTRRMRAADEPGTERLPYPYSPADAADRWTLAVTGPGSTGVQSPLLHTVTATVWALCCLLTYTVRDVAVVLGAHVGATPRSDGVERGRAAAVMTRVLRAEAFRPMDGAGSGRRQARTVAVLAVLAALGAGALVVLGRGTTAVDPRGWLATAVAGPVGDPQEIGLGAEFLLWATVLTLMVIFCDGPGGAWTPEGALRPLLDRGRGPVTFVPGRTLMERAARGTVSEFALDLLATALSWVPVGVARSLVGSAALPDAHAAVDEFAREPAALIGRRRRELLRAGSGSPSSTRGGSPTWDAATRRRWVDARMQERAAGARLVSSDGRTGVPLDGLHVAADGVATLEAVRVHRATVPLLYEGKLPAGFAERLLGLFDDEMRRYATVIRDPRNPVARLRLVVGSDRAGDLLGERARQVVGQDLDLVVVVDPVGG